MNESCTPKGIGVHYLRRKMYFDTIYVLSLYCQIKAMSDRKVYYRMEEHTIKKISGFITVDKDFTQVYDCFALIAQKINKKVSFPLLFWILAYRTDEKNGIKCGEQELMAYNNFARASFGEEISLRTFRYCLNDLVKSKAFYKSNKGQYFAMPTLFWKGDKKDRDTLLIDGAKNKASFYHPRIDVVDIHPLALSKTTEKIYYYECRCGWKGVNKNFEDISEMQFSKQRDYGCPKCKEPIDYRELQELDKTNDSK